MGNRVGSSFPKSGHSATQTELKVIWTHVNLIRLPYVHNRIAVNLNFFHADLKKMIGFGWFIGWSESSIGACDLVWYRQAAASLTSVVDVYIIFSLPKLNIVLGWNINDL